MRRRERRTWCFRAVLVLGVCLIAPIRADAIPITWTLTGDDPLTGTLGNERTFVAVGGEVLTVRAFSTSTSDATSAFVAAYLGRYSKGIGVTNPGEDGSNNSHTVDNVGGKDLVVFKFPSADFIPTSVFLSTFGDTDITAFVGGNAGLTFTSFTGLSYGALGGSGFTQYTSPNAGLFGGNADRTAGLNNSSLNLSGQWLIIGAWKDDIDPEDKFKIKTLTVAPVPEPGTLLLLGSGLAGIGILSRRWRRRTGATVPPR